MRGLFALICICGVLVAGATLPGEAPGVGKPNVAKTAPPLPAPASFSPALFHRPVSVRVRHTQLRPVRNSNTRRIGRSIASLHPTWVTGSLRYARGQYPTRDEVRAWREIRRIVHMRSPAAQFDVVLNAEQFRTPAAIRKAMTRLRAKLGPEGWFFDFLTSSFRRHPRMIRAAVNSAHAHGEWIGGNIFGLEQRRRLPARVDFWSVQDAGLDLNLGAVHELSFSKPILYHLNSKPGFQGSGGCRFIERLNTHRRLAHIRRRASQQVRYRFRVSYPVLFPQCLRARPRGPGSFLYAYNAFRDPPMAQVIGNLLDRYEDIPIPPG